MKEKKVTKISLSTLFLILAVIIIVIMTYFIYKLYNEKTIESKKVVDLNNQVINLESSVNNLQEKINSISNTINNTSVSYIILELEDVEAEGKNQQGLELKNKKITDMNQINSLMKIINSATPYQEKNFIADFGDISPTAKIYLSNGESYTVAASDEYNDSGNIVNLMTKWYSKDGSNKTLYKVNTKLGEQIEAMFNN